MSDNNYIKNSDLYSEQSKISNDGENEVESHLQPSTLLPLSYSSSVVDNTEELALRSSSSDSNGGEGNQPPELLDNKEIDEKETQSEIKFGCIQTCGSEVSACTSDEGVKEQENLEERALDNNNSNLADSDLSVNNDKVCDPSISAEYDGSIEVKTSSCVDSSESALNVNNPSISNNVIMEDESAAVTKKTDVSQQGNLTISNVSPNNTDSVNVSEAMETEEEADMLQNNNEFEHCGSGDTACSNMSDSNDNDLEQESGHVDQSSNNNPGISESGVSDGTCSGQADSESYSFSWDSVRCIFCYNLIAESEPKLLPCLHSACNKCLLNEAAESESTNKDEDIVAMDTLVQCPFCNNRFSQEDVVDNMFIIESSAKHNTLVETFTCTSCTDEATASGLCVECSEWLCEACIQAHKRVKVTKDHTIKSKCDVDSESSASKSYMKKYFCNIHPQEKLNLYCVSCDQLTCRDCQLIEHRDHKYKFAEEMASVTRDQIQQYLCDIRKKRSYIESAKDLVAHRRHEIRKKQASVHGDINKLISTFTDIIRKRGTTLVEILEEVCSTKQEQLVKKNDVLFRLGSQADHCIRVMEAVLESSCDMALLFSKKLLLQQVMKVDRDSPDRKLFDRFKEKLNPGDDISLRISSESRGLGKALKDIGYLVVDNKVYPPQENATATTATVSTTTTTTSTSSSQNKITTTLTSSSSSSSESPSPQPVQAAPQPPALTPMHSHVKQQQTMHHQMQQQYMHQQNNSLSHKFHNFTPQSGPLGHNPPGLVRIQSKTNQMMHGPGSFHPVPPPLTQGRSADVSSSVSSSTHPLNDAGHLRGLLGTGGAFKISSFGPPLNHFQSHSSQQQQQHSAQINSNRIAEQSTSRRTTFQPNLNPVNINSTPIGMPAPNSNNHMNIMNMSSKMGAHTGVNPPIPQKNQQQLLQGLLNSTLSQPQKSDTRQSSPHSTQNQNVKDSCSPTPSWHIPHNYESKSSCIFSSSNNSSSSSTLSEVLDNSFKITLSSNKPACTGSSISSTKTELPKLTKIPGFRSILPKPAQEQSKSLSQESASEHGKGDQSIMNLLSLDSSSSDDKCKEKSASNFADSSSSPPALTSLSSEKLCLENLVALTDGIGEDRSSVGDLHITNGSSCSTTKLLPNPSERSSTEITGSSPTKKDSADLNDDWCAVCWDGGDLVCCDFCPKVYHKNCHIPILDQEPLENVKWQCMMCTDLDCFPLEAIGDKRSLELCSRDLKIAQRILLELYCNYEASQPFRELVDKELTEYYEIIQHPMALEIVKKKLASSNYISLENFVNDIRLIFKNCYEFNPKDTEIYQNAKILEEFFEQLLDKWLPDYAFDFYEDGSNGFSKKRRKLRKDDFALHY